ncbi:MAG: hypothetical protein QOG67_169 [Verrucomicrobiota bacterium]|jgi:hypothetical protein
MHAIGDREVLGMVERSVTSDRIGRTENAGCGEARMIAADRTPRCRCQELLKRLESSNA